MTRCPQCNTTFRIIENQLEVASGAVRCGSCLEIFAARNHLIEVGSLVEFWTESLILDDIHTLPITKMVIFLLI
ncbi:MAG: zinc-ribbon domain-containing protein [Pseudomonadota bacterium]|nr:zinc-ribbon domain-containing protein [Pseudomonadota bacterium]